jgi:sugar lactone lactonase YvrE
MGEMVTAQPLGPAVAELGESPFWSPEENCVWWVDVTGRQVLRTDADTGAPARWPTPHQVGFVARANGALVVGMEQGLFRFDPRAGAFDLIAGTELAPGMRFNDATVDAAGRLWASTMRVANDRAEGAIWVFSGDWRMHRVAEGFRTPNGLAFDAARSRLYFSDSHPTVRRVWHAGCDPQVPALQAPTVFMEFAEGDGRPDGAALDAEGDYWIACLEAGTIEVRSPSGEARRSISLDAAPVVTKLAFGPPGRVFVTSKATPTRPLSGLLACDL